MQKRSWTWHHQNQRGARLFAMRKLSQWCPTGPQLAPNLPPAGPQTDSRTHSRADPPIITLSVCKAGRSGWGGLPRAKKDLAEGIHHALCATRPAGGVGQGLPGCVCCCCCKWAWRGMHGPLALLGHSPHSPTHHRWTIAAPETTSWRSMWGKNTHQHISQVWLVVLLIHLLRVSLRLAAGII